MLMPFCLFLLQRYGQRLQRVDSLIEAGVKLVEVKREIKTQGAVFELDALQRVFDQMQRHLILCDVVGIHFTPKHHLCLHLVVRTVPKLGGHIGGRCAGGGELIRVCFANTMGQSMLTHSCLLCKAIGRTQVDAFVFVLLSGWANPC